MDDGICGRLGDRLAGMPRPPWSSRPLSRSHRAEGRAGLGRRGEGAVLVVEIDTYAAGTVVELDEVVCPTPRPPLLPPPSTLPKKLLTSLAWPS